MSQKPRLTTPTATRLPCQQLQHRPSMPFPASRNCTKPILHSVNSTHIPRYPIASRPEPAKAPYLKTDCRGVPIFKAYNPVSRSFGSLNNHQSVAFIPTWTSCQVQVPRSRPGFQIFKAALAGTGGIQHRASMPTPANESLPTPIKDLRTREDICHSDYDISQCPFNIKQTQKLQTQVQLPSKNVDKSQTTQESPQPDLHSGCKSLSQLGMINDFNNMFGTQITPLEDVLNEESRLYLQNYQMSGSRSVNNMVVDLASEKGGQTPRSRTHTHGVLKRQDFRFRLEQEKNVLRIDGEVLTSYHDLHQRLLKDKTELALRYQQSFSSQLSP